MSKNKRHGQLDVVAQDEENAALNVDSEVQPLDTDDTQGEPTAVANVDSDDSQGEPGVSGFADATEAELAALAAMDNKEQVEDSFRQENQADVPVVAEEEVLLTADEIAKLINNNKVSAIETLNIILAKGAFEYRALAAKLLSYANDMSKSAPMTDPKTAVGKNYDLFIALRAVINTQNYQIFKIKMDIVNLVFKEFKSDAYADEMLSRFTTDWRWDSDSLEAYLNIAILIAALCDITTRQQSLKTISIQLFASRTTGLISPDGVANLEKYYTV